MNKKLFLPLTLLIAILLVASCKRPEPAKKAAWNDPITLSTPAKGDSTIYGLVCDGSGDSAIIILPFQGGDPVSYNVQEARRNKAVIGTMRVGDWVGILPDPERPRVAQRVVDLDQMKGIWCYIVMPKMKGTEQMSRRMQERFANAMPDSVKATYLIPREYGFWLKRSSIAQSVGYVSESSALADESPVVYPPLGWFTGWRMFNCRFIMVSAETSIGADGQMETGKERYDTCSVDYLDDDSLVLSDADGSRSYYRKKSLDDVNVRARAIAKRLQVEALAKATE